MAIPLSSRQTSTQCCPTREAGLRWAHSTHHPEEAGRDESLLREAAEPPAQGGTLIQGQGILCWADGLLCQAHRLELEEREETAAEEAQASIALLVSRGRRQPRSHTHSEGPTPTQHQGWPSNRTVYILPSTSGETPLAFQQLHSLWKSRCIQGAHFF